MAAAGYAPAILLIAACSPAGGERVVDAGAEGTDAGDVDGGASSMDAGPTAPPAVTCDPDRPADCGDDDPLTNAGWAGFCDDRVDDNCCVDDGSDPCDGSFGAASYCGTGDERCPATLPGSAAPSWACIGAPPAEVIAWADFGAQGDAIAAGCVFVYESSVSPQEFYVSVSVTDGVDITGPDGGCAADIPWRRYLYFSDLDGGACDGISYAWPLPVDDEPLSNRCRKAIRSLSLDDDDFSPDVQFFASSREEADTKLGILETAEIACVGVNNLDGAPLRPNEVWTVQAAAPLQQVSP